jgi:hypothetical protein
MNNDKIVNYNYITLASLCNKSTSWSKLFASTSLTAPLGAGFSNFTA